MTGLFRTTVVEISGVRTIAGGGTNASDAGLALLNLGGVSITGDQFISGNKIFGTNNISRSTLNNATILGGTGNTITGGVSNSFIANGVSNTISGSTVESSILNGLSNIIFQGDGSSINSNILGGALNSIQQGFYSSILHGVENSIGAPGVPFQNFSQACSSSIINGSNNKIIGTFNLIGGGSFNTITGIASFNEGLCQTTSRSNVIVGGANNSILNSSCSAILGGRYNEINHNGATIIGDGSLNVKTSKGACTLLMSFANGIFLESPTVNYTGIVNGTLDFTQNIKFTTVTESFSTLNISNQTINIPLNSGMNFILPLTTGITGITFSNTPTNTFGFTLRVDYSGAHSIVWPTGTIGRVLWPNNTAPTLTTTVGREDFFSFITYTSGQEFFGFNVGQNYSGIY